MDGTILKTAVLLALMAFQSITDLVIEHRRTLPEEARKQAIYFSLLPAEGDEQQDLATALRLMVSSSSRQPVIEYCVPQQIGESPLMWARLDYLGWEVKQYYEVVRHYPYDTKDFPALVRADWLLVKLADGKRHDAYRRLLFGLERTKRDEVLVLFGVGNQELLSFGMVEGKSGVAVQGVRLIESRPIARGYCWITSDVFALTEDKDPLENLDRSFKPDGQEIIIGIPKLSLATGDRGAAQVYFLANGAGDVVNEAPVDLVEDSTRFRDATIIVPPGSCIQCHRTGLNAPTKNDYHEFVAAGGQSFAQAEQRVSLDAFYGARVQADIERANEDYAKFVNVACLCAPAEASAAFERAIKRYDRDLDLTTTAIELDSDPARWRGAIATAGVAAGARIVGLAHGRTISRDAWELQYLKAAELVESWRE